MSEDKAVSESAREREIAEIPDISAAISHWKRDFRRGLLQLMILMLIRLRTQDAHGYGLIKLIREAGIQIKAGTIYPLLKRMEDSKLITFHRAIDPDHPILARKIYTITSWGEKMIEEMIGTYNQYDTFVRDLYQEIDNQKRRRS